MKLEGLQKPHATLYYLGSMAKSELTLMNICPQQTLMYMPSRSHPREPHLSMDAISPPPLNSERAADILPEEAGGASSRIVMPRRWASAEMAAQMSAAVGAYRRSPGKNVEFNFKFGCEMK